MKKCSKVERSTKMNAVVFCLGITMLLVTAFVSAQDSLPYYDSPEFTPRWHSVGSPSLKDFHRIPPFSFTNQNGTQISNKSLANKVYVASFFFSSCPGICPTIKSKLEQVQQQFLSNDRVNIVSYSIRPTTDTVKVLQNYAIKNGIKSNKWHLLTGDKTKIYDLARNAYFADEDLGSTEDLANFLHTENLLLIDQNSHIRGVYNGLSTSSVKELIADINLLTLSLR